MLSRSSGERSAGTIISKLADCTSGPPIMK
jgi:hypothetical protein